MSEICLDIDLRKVCRICLSQTDMSETLFNIFTDAIVDGMFVALVEVIEDCVGIQFKNSQELPNKICQTCKSIILQFHVFKQKCSRAETVLRNMLDHRLLNTDHREESFMHDSVQENKSNIPPFVEYVEETIEEEVVAVVLNSESKSMVPYETWDNLSTKTPDELHPDKDSVAINEEEYLSELCDGNLHSVPISEPSTELNNFTPIGSNHRHICDICGKVALSRSRLMKHTKVHNDSQIVLDHMRFFVCNFCRFVFLREQDLCEHRTQCSGCVVALPDDENDLCDDRTYAESSKPVLGRNGVCGICNARYDDMTRVKQHIITHLEKFPCPLEGCGCEYSSLARLTIHISNQHVDYLSPNCPHCKEVIERVDLRQHIRLYCKAKQYECTHCDKKFLSWKSLSQHLKKLEQTFYCLQCDKSYSSLASLKLHERSHTGERPYVCTICNKSYKTPSLRTAHMDTHIEGKTFKCEMCGKSLQTRACYRNHVKRHLEQRNHECTVCGKRFFQKSTLRVHLKMVHRLPGDTLDAQ